MEIVYQRGKKNTTFTGKFFNKYFQVLKKEENDKITLNTKITSILMLL